MLLAVGRSVFVPQPASLSFGNEKGEVIEITSFDTGVMKLQSTNHDPK
jgi:hypothetical protein